MKKLLMTALLGCAAAGSASAAVLSFDFVARTYIVFGTVDHAVYPGTQAGTTLAAGDIVTGKFSYDTNTAASETGVDHVTYQSPAGLNSFEYTIVQSGQKFSSNPHSRVSVSNDVGLNQFPIAFDAFGMGDLDTNTVISMNAGIDVLNSFAFPTAGQLLQFGGQLMATYSAYTGETVMFLASINQLSFAGETASPTASNDVPEPATPVMLLTGLAIAGLLSRRGKR